MTSGTEFRDRACLVLGLGAFGGGAGCARQLVREGARVTVTDLRQAGELQEACAALAGLPVEWALGGHSAELFASAPLVVVNPAVPSTSPWLDFARQRGCIVTSDAELGIERAARWPALAVTGTHGKSSCAALAHHLLERAFPGSVLAGNLGGSVFERVGELGPLGRLVLELSSFQTERLQAPPGWPHVALLTGLGADHLDRHGDLSQYHLAKRRILASQDTEGLVVLPAGDAAAEDWVGHARGRIAWFSAAPLPPGRDGWELAGGVLRERHAGRVRELADATALPFPEPYRAASAVAAVAGARALGLATEVVAARLRSFPGLPHRMEPIPSPAGLKFVDNGVATHPDPTTAALTWIQGPVVLLAGGKDKGLGLEALAAVARNCRALHLFGAGGARLFQVLGGRAAGAVHHSGCRSAIEAAVAGLRPGETLLFSPSFSSYDEFRNFRERAGLFREICANAGTAADRTTVTRAGQEPSQ
ncbi:MAG TPA: UDP-N-acetylmuramoyl-L-alanine--D-glutamate ligase [Planctomycetota bacterium]